MKILIASDHGGFSLKLRLIDFLKSRQIDVEDLGSESADSVDYPDYAERVAERISKKEADAGILVCGTGIGMCIVANKFRGIRAAVVSDPYSARMAKEHNNANVLCIGGRVLEKEAPHKAEDLLAAWMDAHYEGGRHDRRLKKIQEIERRNFKV